MHNTDHPCASDIDWYDDGGCSADELDESRESRLLEIGGNLGELALILIFHPFADILSPVTHTETAGVG
jgi:hypothetical protein